VITDPGIILATAVPLLCLLTVAALGRVGRRASPLVAIALVWGFASTWVVVGFNDRWSAAFGLSSLIVLGAPIMEELAKSLATPFLAASRRCTWFVDGTIVGLAAGTGFAIRENWLYLDNAPDGEGLGIALARITSTNLMHAGCSAIVGAAIALAWTRGWLRRISFTIAALACSMALHSGFNRLTRQQERSPLTITAAGVAVFLVATGIVALGLPLTRRWARADLARRGATLSEQSALAGGSQHAALLDEFESRYGSQAAAGAERLVELQRRLAIGRAGGRMSDAELAELQALADEQRRALGLHAMTWLRSHLPVDPDAASMWVELDQFDSAELASEPAHQPVGLWARLDDATSSDNSPATNATETNATATNATETNMES